MPYVEGRTVGEQQKNSTFKPHMEWRTVGRQQKNQHLKKTKVVRKGSLLLFKRMLDVLMNENNSTPDLRKLLLLQFACFGGIFYE